MPKKPTKEKKIKVIIFDNNGVLTTNDSEDGYNKVAEFLEVETHVLKPVWSGELAQALDEGKITCDDFLKNVMSMVGAEKDLDDFRSFYLGRYVQKHEVRDFAKRIGNDFEIALLTNFGDGFHEFNKRWKLEEIFEEDKIFLSCDMKMRKPNDDIFLSALESLGRKPEEAVFIDDNHDNIDTAGRLGMATILFESLEQVEKDLQNILQYDYA
ncbi:MAG: HAD family phosphatase [bacterium]|nr:HAD family phosphatase [bacterium]